MKMAKTQAVILVAVLGGFEAPGQDLLQSAANQAQADLDDALHELATLRERVGSERAPLVKRLGALEEKALAARRGHDDAVRSRGPKTADMTDAIEAMSRESEAIADLLDGCIRDFDARVRLGESEAHRQLFDAASALVSNPRVPMLDRLDGQMKAIEAAVDRVARAAGGELFKGRAVAPDGEVKTGSFALVGPIAIFLSDDGATAGLVKREAGSAHNKVVGALRGESLKQARDLVTTGRGELPIVTAPEMLDTPATPLGLLSKGGPLMVPILLLALVSFSVGIVKLVRTRAMRGWSMGQIGGVFREVNTHGVGAGLAYARRLGGPVGEMFVTALGHLGQPREVIEAIMFEKVLAARVALNSHLPVIALCASAAPLLGLLGTVICLNEVVRAIGATAAYDARALSGEISDALLATEFGLLVAIPSLLLHAFLTRRARGVVQNMEKAAAAFLGRLPDRKDSEEIGHEVRPGREEAWHGQVSVV